MCIWVCVWQQQEMMWICGCWPFSNTVCLSLCPADEGLHQGAERAAVQQRRGTSECTEVRMVEWISAREKVSSVSKGKGFLSSHLSLPFRYTTRHLNDDSTSKQIRALLQWKQSWWQREGGNRSALEGGKWGDGGNECQWLINLFVYKEQRNSSPGLAKPDDNKRKIIIYIVSCPSFCLSFCKVRKEKKSQKRKYRYILKQVKSSSRWKVGFKKKLYWKV